MKIVVILYNNIEIKGEKFMDKWEYKVKSIKLESMNEGELEDLLNAMGEDNYELVSSNVVVYDGSHTMINIFKRRYNYL